MNATKFFTKSGKKNFFLAFGIDSPEQLWILNPKRILKRLDLDQTKVTKEIELQEKNTIDGRLLPDDCSISSKDCWICYDNETQDAGPLIQPCQCRGDVSAVHHDCLRRWLVEVSVKRISKISISYISLPNEDYKI